MTQPENSLENTQYLTEQLITYIGNKRSLLSFIGEGVEHVCKTLGKEKLDTFDVFSGSGIVSRFLKQYSDNQYANDMEDYGKIISSCYLANKSEVDSAYLTELHVRLKALCTKQLPDFLNDEMTSFKSDSLPGFISEYYAPHNMEDIHMGERCFYTPYNACYIDCMRKNISEIVPQELSPFFIAPLLSEASIHANTGGVFKGFYKNSKTGIGKFGGNGANALTRINGHISLPYPVFSNFESRIRVFQNDANILAGENQVPHVDLAYIDPPYNQHPYGSNYFMLNLIANYRKPDQSIMSRVSGIPKDWNRSLYNKKRMASQTFLELAAKLDTKYLLVSFNNEGFISEEEMVTLLTSVGKVTVLESKYNAYRASRNLNSRSIHTKEYLYVVEKFPL